MKKFLIWGSAIVVVLLVAVVVLVSVFLDSAVKKGVETYGPQLAKVPVTLESVSISILSGSGGIKALVVGNPEGFKTAHAISVGHASVAVSPGSLLSDKIVIKHIRVEAPEITFEGGLRENNLSKILDNLNAAAGGSGAAPSTPKESGPAKKLQVDEFLIKDAKIFVSLTSMGGQVIPVTVPDIKLTNLGSGPEGITAAELSQRVLNQILKAASEAASNDAVKNASKLATDAINEAGAKATDRLKGVGDLLNKKN